MHIVQQLTPFTCGLACLESFTTDSGHPYTQGQLLVKYKNLLYNDVPDKGDFGAASDHALQTIWTDLGYKGVWVWNHNQDEVRDKVFKAISQKQAILIMSDMEKEGWHCIRFEKVLDNNSISAMVTDFPNATTVCRVSFQDLIAWDFRFAILTP